MCQRYVATRHERARSAASHSNFRVNIRPGDLPARVRRAWDELRIWTRYLAAWRSTRAYLSAYRADLNYRVHHDSRDAVGEAWEEIGELQFEFMRRSGLQPSHRMLDIGCGRLRGGRHFIAYLDAGCYTGIDISSGVVEFGRQLVEREHLTGKRPRLLVSDNGSLTFSEFDGEVFDYLLAQSVFTHLMPEQIEECFRHIGRIMHDKSFFCFTFKLSPRPIRRGLNAFSYPLAFFQTTADRHGFDLVDCSSDYPHPRGQRMMRASRKGHDAW